MDHCNNGINYFDCFSDYDKFNVSDETKHGFTAKPYLIKLEPLNYDITIYEELPTFTKYIRLINNIKIMDYFNYFTLAVSVIALTISILNYYFSKPKLLIEHRKTFGSSKMVEKEGYFVPNFILQISNLRNIPVEVAKFSLILSKGKVIKDVNVIIKPFSSMSFYFGDHSIYILIEGKRQDIINIRKFTTHIGIENDLERNLIKSYYPVFNSFVIPKEGVNKKPEEIEIEINTSIKKYKKKIKMLTKEDSKIV